MAKKQVTFNDVKPFVALAGGLASGIIAFEVTDRLLHAQLPNFNPALDWFKEGVDAITEDVSHAMDPGNTKPYSNRNWWDLLGRPRGLIPKGWGFQLRPEDR